MGMVEWRFVLGGEIIEMGKFLRVESGWIRCSLSMTVSANGLLITHGSNTPFP